MKKQKTKIFFLFLLSMIFVLGGFRCTFIQSKEEKNALKPVRLNYWRVWEGRNELNDILNAYRSLHPNISINVRTLRFEEFEKELLEALAKDEAPDLVSLHQTWLKKYVDEAILTPMPPDISMAYQYRKKTLGIKEETIVEFRTIKTPTLGQIKEKYIDDVSDKVVFDNKVYGLPYSVDTLVLFYNRDLLNNAGLPTPPKDWATFQNYIKTLTFFDENRNIAVVGTALGTSNNVRRSTDIVSLLMMQNGTVMQKNKNIYFHTIPEIFPDNTYHPGVEAVRFYTDFADPTREVYTWNKTRDDSLVEFSRNNVAFYLGYSYDIPEIIAASKGSVNFGISTIPQISSIRPVNYANYWVEAVTQKSKFKNEAWDFILFASDPGMVKTFLTNAQRPTALRELISEQTQDDLLRPFAEQLLTARSWYQGNNVAVAEEAIKGMINDVLNGTESLEAINFAAKRVQETIK